MSTKVDMQTYILGQVFQNYTKNDSTSIKCARIFCYGVGGAVSCASCVVPSYIALTYDEGNSQFLSTVGIIGVGIDFAIFGTHGWVLLTRHVLKEIASVRFPVHQNKNMSLCVEKSAIAVGSVLWGVGGRLQAAGLAVKFASSLPFGVVGGVGGAGPAIWSAYNTIKKLINVKNKDALHHKRLLIRDLKQLKQIFFRRVSSNNAEQINFIFRFEVLAPNSLEHINTQIVAFLNAQEVQSRESSTIKAARIVCIVPCFVAPSMCMIQLWLLTVTFFRVFSNYDELNFSLSAFAVSSYLFIMFAETWKTAFHFFNKIMGLLSCIENEQTEIEAFFPRAHYLFDTISLLIALMPYSELISISQKYADENTLFDQETNTVLNPIFVYGSYVGWVMVLFQSVRQLIVINSIIMHGKKYGSLEIRDNIKTIECIDRLLAAIQDLDEDEVKMLDLKTASTNSASINESSPLLDTQNRATVPK